jgi:DNA invertase Pin-like site-specific DNA recombinase
MNQRKADLDTARGVSISGIWYKFVGYIRVSTTDQGKNGHGLDAQKAAIAAFVEREGGELVRTFQEIESGSNDHREVFWKAVEAAAKAKATLVVSKLDRLSRSGIRFMVELDKRGVSYVAADNPSMTKLVVHILAAVGEDERQRISQRTREALEAAKVKGKRLGNPRWQDSIKAAREVQIAKAAKRAKLLRPIIEGLRSSGIVTYTGLAEALNERGIETPQGRRWHPMTVKRAIEVKA